MTERYQGFVVVLDEEMREDDAECTINAIRQIKGVIKVSPVTDDNSKFCVLAREEIEARKIFNKFIVQLDAD